MFTSPGKIITTSILIEPVLFFILDPAKKQYKATKRHQAQSNVHLENRSLVIWVVEKVTWFDQNKGEDGSLGDEIEPPEHYMAEPLVRQAPLVLEVLQVYAQDPYKAIQSVYQIYEVKFDVDKVFLQFNDESKVKDAKNYLRKHLCYV